MADDTHPSLETPNSRPGLESESQQNQLEISYLIAMTPDGGPFGGHYLAAIQREEEDFAHGKEKERDDFIAALTFEEMRQKLEEDLADLNRRIEENRARIKQLSLEIEDLDERIAGENTKIEELKTQKKELEQQNERLKEQQKEMQENLRHMESHVTAAERGLMTALTSMTPESRAAAEALMTVAESRIIVEAKIKGDPEDEYQFHPVFRDGENGEMYILHPSKGRTELKDLESANARIPDLEKHARYQEQDRGKAFLDGSGKAVAEDYYKNMTEFQRHIAVDDENAGYVQRFREKHRDLEGDVYQYHELSEKRLEIETKIQENNEKIEKIDSEIRQRTDNVAALESRKAEAARERARLEAETKDLEQQAESIKKQLKTIDRDVERQVEAIEHYGRISAPEGFYEHIAQEKYAGCMSTLGSPGEIMQAAKTFDSAIKDMALANVASEAIKKALAGHESRYAQIRAKYGDDTAKMAAAVITTKDANGKDVPVYRNDKTGSVYTLGEDGKKAIIRDVKTIAELTLQGYAEGRLFADEFEAVSTGNIPSTMLTDQVFGTWSQAAYKTASKNIVRAAENFGNLTQAPEDQPAPDGEAPAQPGLSEKFNGRADAAPEPENKAPENDAPESTAQRRAQTNNQFKTAI